MRRAIGMSALLAAVSGCATFGAQAPDECAEVARLQTQSQVVRGSALSMGGQAGAWRVRTVSTLDPAERRHEQMENRRASDQLYRRAAELHGRAGRLESEARAAAAELRAEGIHCPVRRR